MHEIIASRQMFIKDNENFTSLTITVSKPIFARTGFFECRVSFTSTPKYDKTIKGIDSINALKCALTYIDGICTNSEDPKFHWDEPDGTDEGQ